METLDQARDTILKELTADDSEVRRDYLKHFEATLRQSPSPWLKASVRWREFDAKIKEDEKARVCLGFGIRRDTPTFFNEAVPSGQTVAAGNLFRQVMRVLR